MQEILELHSPKYWLRWRFDYSDGKPSKVGGWLNPGDEKNQHMLAYMQSKENLLRACVEVKNIETNCVAPYAECEGQDFCTFEWVARAAMPAFFKGSVQIGGNVYGSAVVGLTLVSRNERIRVTIDGQIKRTPRTDADRATDKLFHYGRT